MLEIRLKVGELRADSIDIGCLERAVQKRTVQNYGY